MGRNRQYAAELRGLLDVKRGLRVATRDEDAKPDLLSWLSVMRRFVDPAVADRLLQKARYEIAVAELRGRGSLDPAISHVQTLFDNLSIDQTPAELLDASVLAVYASGAVVQGQTTVSVTTVRGWIEKANSIVQEALANSQRKGDRCVLLEARAMLSNVPFSHLTMEERKSAFFNSWRDVVKEVKEVPYYPITEIAEILELVIPIFGMDPRFRNLADDVDQLVSDRAGKGVAADHARKRAIAHLNTGRHVAAIDQLQRTKIGWFTGEALEGSILAMLVISQSFEELGLHFAARYYAAAAFYSVLHLGSEELQLRLGQAAFRLADTFHAAGEGITFLHSIAQALLLHDAVASEPHDWTKHVAVQRSVTHALILRAIAQRLWPSVLPVFDAAIAKWRLPKRRSKNLSPCRRVGHGRRCRFLRLRVGSRRNWANIRLTI